MRLGVLAREAARRDDPSNLRGPSSRTPRHPMPGNIHTGIGTTTQLHVFYRFFPWFMVPWRGSAWHNRL